jgi:hypothetical protein
MNPEIIDRIKYHSENEDSAVLSIGDCPTCGAEKACLYDTEKRTNLDELFYLLGNLYTPEYELPNDYPESKKNYLFDELKNRWNLFNKNLSDQKINSIIKSFYKERPELFVKKIGIKNIARKDILLEHSLVGTSRWDDFINEIKTKNRFHTGIVNEKMLMEYCSFLEKKYKKGDVFFRGRVSNNKDGFSMKKMGAPPFEKATAGRANAEGISRLYLANNKKTTIHEIRAGAYDVITVGKFVLKKDILVVDFQALENIYPFAEGINLLEFAINIEHLRMLNREMSKVLRRNDSLLDYVPTQYISDYIKSFQDYRKEPRYRGIKYQSTMNKDGYNLVAFYPNDFLCISVETIEISDIQYTFPEEA